MLLVNSSEMSELLAVYPSGFIATAVKMQEMAEREELTNYTFVAKREDADLYLLFPKGRVVYVVTTGDYSDYRINAIFSTEEMAQKYIVKAELEYEPRVEHWPIDAVDMGWLNNEYNSYRITIRKDRADLVDISGYYADNIEGLEEEGIEEKEYYNGMYYVYKIRARDKEHAAKIAMEWRTAQILSDELREAAKNG